MLSYFFLSHPCFVSTASGDIDSLPKVRGTSIFYWKAVFYLHRAFLKSSENLTTRARIVMKGLSRLFPIPELSWEPKHEQPAKHAKR